jgi:FixJ family two-component response regulator
MTNRWHIHVIDPDFRRRAGIAYELSRLNLHAEIYETLEEFCARIPEDGMVFVADEPECGDLTEFANVLGASGRALPLAAYSTNPSPQRIVEVVLGGALDYLRWPFEPQLLEATLDRLSDLGERRARQARRGAMAKAAVEHLSERELEVLELMIEGNSNKEIGRQLSISPRTVEIHRANMMRKLNARSPSDAVRLAMLAGVDRGDDEHLIAA